MKINEDKNIIGVDGEDNVANEDKIKLKKFDEPTYHKCDGCKSTPVTYRAGNNKLYCSTCANDSICFQILPEVLVKDD